MKYPAMAAITDSLEKSFRNFSLNHRLTSPPSPGPPRSSSSFSSSSSSSSSSYSSSSSSSSSSDDEHHHRLHQHHRFDTTLELNSHISLPPFWEQCLDLKTGEVYYINCRTGMRVKEDPRTAEADGRDLYSEDDDSYSDGSEELPSSSSCGHNRTQYHAEISEEEEEDVLVVAGCKRCFMYFMVPKQVEDCPKCSSDLVHFDRSDENGFP